MFKELAPLLRHRSVLLTVTHLEEDQFRVNVVPRKISDSDNDALTTPLRAAQAEARAKSKPDTKKDTQAKATVPTSAANEKPEPPKTTGLFDMPAEPIRTAAVATASRALGAAADEEEEILAEIAEREEESVEDDSAA
jgi:hypothetical protein